MDYVMLVDFITQVGFPIFVATYFLINNRKSERIIAANTASTKDLKHAVNKLEYAIKMNGGVKRNG